MAPRKRQDDMRNLVRGVFRTRAREPLLALGTLREAWPNVVGPELGAKTHPARLDGATLWIATPDACWSYELQFFKRDLISSVQAYLGTELIRDVRFTADAPQAAREAPPPAAISAAPTEAPEAAPEAAPEVAPGAAPPPAALSRAAQAIGDASLRAVFERSLAKQRRNRAAQDTAPAARAAPAAQPPPAREEH